MRGAIFVQLVCISSCTNLSAPCMQLTYQFVAMVRVSRPVPQPAPPSLRVEEGAGVSKLPAYLTLNPLIYTLI